MFVVSKPDVFKSPTADTYIIFGEAKIEDLAAKQAALNQEQIRQQQQQQRAESKFNANKAPTPSNDTATATAAAQGSEEINSYFNSTVLNHPIIRGYVMYRDILLFENELSSVIFKWTYDTAHCCY